MPSPVKYFCATAMPSSKTSAASQGKKKTKVKGGTTKKSDQKKKQSKKFVGPRGQSQSCHQCRQSIHSSKGVSEVKSGKERVKCSQCTRYWCEQCLRNRYGIEKTLVDPTTWVCPVCCGNCNCSLCRKKEGKLATGILTPLVKNAGYDSVSEFLTNGTDDIAKCLQWKSPSDDTRIRRSPTGKHQSPTLKAPRKPQSPTPKGSRKRKRHRTEQENSTETDICPTADPLCGCHGDEPKLTPKRRRLSHSEYSITVEEDPLCGEHAGSAKDETSSQRPVLKSSYQDDTPDDDLNLRTQHSLRRKKPRKRIDSTPKSSDEGQSPDIMEFLEQLPLEESPFRRSPRRKTLTRTYNAQNFIDSPEKQHKKRKAKSPRKNFSNGLGRKLETKHDELDSLREAQLSAIRSKKVEERQTRQEEQSRRREELREQKLCEKEELRSVKEKHRLARSILKDAQRDKVRRERERMKLQKSQQLEELKQKKSAEKKQLQELMSAPVVTTIEEVTLEPDSPEECVMSGIPDLPKLASLEYGVSMSLLPRLLFVTEFLYVFAEALKLKRKLSAEDLLSLLSSGRGLSDVYLRLLQAVMEGGDKLRKDLKPSKRQRELEMVAKQYLHQAGRNGFVTDGGHCVDGASVEESIVILEHLCLETLESDVIRDHMESMREKGEQMRKERRAGERKKTKEIGVELKQMCENGCSLEEMEGKRSEVTRELAEMRNSAERDQYVCSLMTRNLCLGEDRYGRTYWRLQCVPGVVVESPGRGEGGSGTAWRVSVESPGRGEGGSGTAWRVSVESQGRGEGGSGTAWRVINSEEMLQEVMDCLHPRGQREKHLHHALELHWSTLIRSLGT